MPERSVIIPVYGRSDLTRQCLDTLLAQDLGDCELIVVDDASPDDTALVLEEYGDRIKVVTHGENTGYAAACNDGAAAAGGDYLVFLNNDTVPVAGWLDALVRCADETPEAAVVGAKLLFLDNTIQHAGVAISVFGHPHHIYVGFPEDHPAVNKGRRFQAVTAACMLVKRGPFEAATGFDRGFVNGFEDVDLCLRLGEQGHEIHYCPRSVVYHLESVTRGDESADLAENVRLLLERWGKRIRPDQLDYYIEDGLVRVDYSDHGSMTIRVSPLVGEAGASEDVGFARLLDQRTRQVFDITRENERLRRAAEAAAPMNVIQRPDASRLIASWGGIVPGDPEAGVLLAEILERKVRPLALARSPREPARVNILVPELDLRHFFGGYIAKIQLAARLAQAGLRVRVITVDPPSGGSPAGPRDIEQAAGIQSAQSIETADGSNRSEPLAVSAGDVFVASTWWTAHIAHAATAELGRERFVYLIQEYEPFTFPMGSYAAAARTSYDLPHYALFSSALLRDYFRDHAVGVFAPGEEDAARLSLVFDNAITEVGPVAAEELARRSPKRLLFYARPSGTEARNLFELGYLGLCAAIREGIFDEDWRFTAIGTGGARSRHLELPESRDLVVLPRQEPVKYRGVLRSHDLGMSLMHTPHPSLVPIEMAAAGMPVVTSTFENKTAEALAAISANFVAVEPSVEGVVSGLREAVVRVADAEARARGAGVSWSTSWDASLGEARMEGIRNVLDLARDAS